MNKGGKKEGQMENMSVLEGEGEWDIVVEGRRGVGHI